jgi:hypothetical protein
MERISFVLNIHAVLHLVFDNSKGAYDFPSMPNNNDFFNGHTPFEILSQGSMIILYETYRRINALSKAPW